MTKEEYWKKHIELKGGGMNCNMCESRFSLGWNAAIKYGFEPEIEPSQESGLGTMPDETRDIAGELAKKHKTILDV